MMAVCNRSVFQGAIFFGSFFLAISAQAEFQNQYQPYQPQQVAQPAPAALPKPKAPKSTVRVLPPAFDNDSPIKDLSKYPGAPNVYLGVLLRGEPIEDAAVEKAILTLVNNACQGLKDVHGLGLDGQGGVKYNNTPLQIYFYWYEYNKFDQLVSSGAMKPENQTKLNEMFRQNLSESIDRANWVPPTYASLNVPPPLRVEYKKFKGEEITLGAEEFARPLVRLKKTLQEINGFDPALGQKMSALLKSSKVLVKKNRNNLDLTSNSMPTLIYQIVRYTPSAIMIAGSSFDKAPEEYQSDAMLFALMMGVLPEDELRTAKAVVFHMDVLALNKDGVIDAKAYQEAKRRYAASGPTLMLMDLGNDFETYTVRLQEHYRLSGIKADNIVANLRNLTDYMKVDIERSMARDFEALFGEKARDLGAETPEELAARFRYRTWNLMSQWLVDPKETGEAFAKRLDTVSHVLDLAMQGKISGPEMDAWVKEKESIEKKKKEAAAAQPQVAPPPPGN